MSNGRTVTVIDLPGTYSLVPTTPDEIVTLDVIEANIKGAVGNTSPINFKLAKAA